MDTPINPSPNSEDLSSSRAPSAVEGLAPAIVRYLVDACRSLAAAGQTIVLVEQNIAATLALAQRVYILNNGHLVHEGPADEIRGKPEVLQRYLGV